MESSFVEDMLNESMDSLSLEPRSCNCHSTCSRARGKGQCPCRAIGLDCSDRCTCGTKKKTCTNKTNDDSASATEESEDDVPTGPVGAKPTKRRRTSQTASHNDADKNHLDQQLLNEEEMIKSTVEGLSRDELNKLAISIIGRTPGLYEDFMEQFVRPSTPSTPENPRQEVPNWCKCGRCREMNREVEKKCCRQIPMECHSISPRFARLCLDPHVLDIVRFNLEDQYAQAGDRGNRSYRHAAYRTYVHWQHGRLGRGNRRVVPSCCTWAIRDEYPAANGHYVGYQDGIGYRDD